jgi:GGDEF domain-containing protein
MRRIVRQADQVYVLDHGRFAVLLPGAQGHAAVLAAERIRAGVENDCSATGDEADNSAQSIQSETATTVTVAAVEAGFRHEASRDVYDEAVSLLASSEQAGPNRVVWPRKSRPEAVPDEPS